MLDMQKDSETGTQKDHLILGQVKKSAGRMPWHQEPMKDATSCEKPRGAANRYRFVDVRMGQPDGAILHHPMVNT